MPRWALVITPAAIGVLLLASYLLHRVRGTGASRITLLVRHPRRRRRRDNQSGDPNR